LRQSAESAERQTACWRQKEQTVLRSSVRNADTSKRHCEFINPRVAAELTPRIRSPRTKRARAGNLTTFNSASHVREAIGSRRVERILRHLITCWWQCFGKIQMRFPAMLPTKGTPPVNAACSRWRRCANASVCEAQHPPLFETYDVSRPVSQRSTEGRLREPMLVKID
jgi:hypothetical protein